MPDRLEIDKNARRHIADWRAFEAFSAWLVSVHYGGRCAELKIGGSASAVANMSTWHRAIWDVSVSNSTVTWRGRKAQMSDSSRTLLVQAITAPHALGLTAGTATTNGKPSYFG